MTQRITLSMSVQEVVMAMAEGNPGALRACMELLKHTEAVDPDAAMGGIASLLVLDSSGIYGSRIYMLWSDVCGCDVKKMLAVMRANQLGQLAGVTKVKLDHAIDNRGDGIDLDEVMKAVQKELPNFNKDS